MTASLRQLALQGLLCADPAEKVQHIQALSRLAQRAPDAHWATAAVLSTPDAGVPGRPAQPILVSPQAVERRSLRTAAGHAALMHALTHIEFNAMNLALDVVWRFANLPVQFYQNWVQVAVEEAYHFSLLQQHLATLGARYGDFPAHNGLWDMAERTKDDVLARMALVPRTLEARGLDACPAMRDKLLHVGDTDGAAIIEIILRDEIGHVAIGNYWYAYLCEQAGCAPICTYKELAKRHRAPKLRGPFNLLARQAAGFSEAELAALQEI